MAFTTVGFARKLKLLRESFENQLEEVSQATGIDVPSLAAFESGRARPTGDQVLIFADYFKCDLAWLLDDAAQNPDENIALLLRTEGGRLAPTDRHAIAEFVHMCKSQAMLEELLDIPRTTKGFSFVPSGKFFKQQGKDCALAYRSHYRLALNAVIPDIFSWLRSVGFRLFRRSLPNSPISALFVRHPEAGHCILINLNEDPYRQRFSAAHEVGHALLDTDKEFNVSAPSDDASADLIEVRANAFASNFLMPPDLLRMLATAEQWRQPEKLIEAADKLFVSIPAVLSALVRDKIIDNETRSKLRDLKLRPPNKKEPELSGDLTPRQRERKAALLSSGLHSEYVNQAFEVHRRGLISLAKLADIFLVDPSDVGELAEIFGTSFRHG